MTLYGLEARRDWNARVSHFLGWNTAERPQPASNSGLRELSLGLIQRLGHVADIMNSGIFRHIVLAAGITLTFSSVIFAQQDTGPIQGNAGQASQPGGVTSGPGNPASGINAGSPGASNSVSTSPTGTTPAPATAPGTDKNTPATDTGKPNTDRSTAQTDSNTPQSDEPRTILSNSADANSNDPLLEPPALPKTKPTLIGGTAARIDHVRNLLTIQPFGGGQKVKMFIDERTQIYRNGAATTVLGIHKGDRVYADTMLDGSRVFAKNVRVENQAGTAEVRGQVTGMNREKGTVTVRDELSAQPVTFSVADGTQYSALKGSATSSDLQPGSLVDVQFAVGKDKRDVAKQVILLAKPGDSYVFSGVVTNIDLRDGTLALQNRSDEQTYELHFDQSAVDDRSKLKVGSEVTAHAVFTGKQYNANDLQLQAASGEEQPKPESKPESNPE